jgi:hypothetical protein
MVAVALLSVYMVLMMALRALVIGLLTLRQCKRFKESAGLQAVQKELNAWRCEPLVVKQNPFVFIL